MSVRFHPRFLPRQGALRLACLATVALAGAAYAQAQTQTQTQTQTQAPADAAAGTPTPSALDRVTIQGQAQRERSAGTASKLPLTLRETPQSLSQLDRSRMELENLNSVDDALKQVTGVHVSLWDTQRPAYFARGFKVTDFQVDGVPSFSSATNQEYDTALYERIEILRGANGLGTGVGTPSATVNLTRKRAQRAAESSAALTLGSWQHRRLELDLNRPLLDNGRVRGRVVAALQDRDGFRDRYGERKLAYLATVEADLAAGSTLTLGLQDQDNQPRGPIWGTIPRFASDGSLAQLPRSTSFSPLWTRWSRQSRTVYATLDQPLGPDWQLKVAATRTRGESFSLRTYGSGFVNPSTGAGLFLLAGVGETFDTRSGLDVALTGQFALLGRRHDAVLGANVARTRSRTINFDSLGKWRYDIPDIRRWDGSAPEPTVRRDGSWKRALTDQDGVFANVRWRLAEPLSLLTGARLTDWKTRSENYAASGAHTSTTGVLSVRREVSPYLGLVHELSRDWSAYASYTNIFQPQDYKDKSNELLSPVLGSNTELGLKAELLGKRLLASLALFQVKQDNYAVRDPSQPEKSLPDGSSAYMAVDGTRSRGLELDLNGSLAPGWTVAAGYTHTRITRHEKDLIYANLPRHQVQASTSLRLPGAWHRLTVGGGVNWQSAVLGHGVKHPTSGTVTVRQGAYPLVNLHAQFKLSEQFNLGLSVRNALDKVYWTNLDYANYGDPRSVMLTLRGHL